MPICAHCGRPVEGEGDPLDPCHAPGGPQAAETVLHPECVLAYSLRDRPPSGRVLMYEGPEIGPLAPEQPE